jgi:hypothetical protein
MVRDLWNYRRELVFALLVVFFALASFALGYRLGASKERTPIIIETSAYFSERELT